jgi:hypothetical protein
MNFTRITFCTPVSCGIIAVLMIASSCYEGPQKNDLAGEKKLTTKPPILKKPGSSLNDTIVIHSPSAVFYNPDSLQMKKIKQINEEAVYSTLTHDCYYQMQNARLVIRKYWPHVKIVENSKARYLLFVKADRSKICVDLNNKNDICGVFLFDGEKDPVLADMPNIDTSMGFYFSQ